MEGANRQIIEILMDKLNKGLIYIDNHKKVRLANQRAKEITGINIGKTLGHEGGRIEPGDIIVIADNKIGEDDGRLSLDELRYLNIYDGDIRQRDALIAMGIYMNKDVLPEYKYMREHQLDKGMSIKKNYYGFNIRAEINDEIKVIDIVVNDVSYKLDYYDSVGHLVVIDGSTGRVKFFQAKGYSVRKEDLANLLRGQSFVGKSEEFEDIDVNGTPFLKLFDNSLLSKKLFEIIDSQEEIIIDQLFEINKRPFICSIIPWQEDKENNKMGAFLILEDSGVLEEAINQRNEIIKKLELKNKPSYESKILNEVLDSFTGNSSKSMKVKYMAYKASQNKFNVIITGESGTGKSKLAREIHNLGDRNTPFVEVNCNSIASTLFESELFGYVGGAFTGARADGKKGFFEEADKGILFLDEIGEIPLEIQGKLLHVLQNKIIYRVGSSKPTKVDVRVIAATNKNLEKEVLEGRFRQDLYYRINVFPIHIPPIRERKSDLYILINQILKETCKEYNMEQKQFSGGALERLMEYDWPGNIRELENVIQRATTLSEAKIIYSEHLKLGNHTIKSSLKDRLEEQEKRIIEEVLIKNGGDKLKAMKELELSKTTFYEKLKKYNIKNKREPL